MDAERRQVTVTFHRHGGLHDLLRTVGRGSGLYADAELSKLMDEAVREQGGVVQGFTGDGIMAVFGAPVAFEDAPLRACRAALSILATAKDRRAATSKPNTACGRNCASASIPG